jgi:hypothetical protein
MPALPPPIPAFQVSIYSSGTSKGIAQTTGPQIIGRAELGAGPIYVAAYAKNVTSPTLDAEAGATIGVRTDVDGFKLAASATARRAINPAPGSDATSLEVAASVARKVGRVTPTLSIVYSPDDLGSTKRSVYIEGGASYAISKQLSASAAIGLRNRVVGADYTAWSAGLTWTPIKRLALDARYYDTNGGSQWPYQARFVGGGSFKF